MDMYPVLLLFAGLVAMDTTAGPQFLISEPFVSCTILGFLFGNVELGLLLGTLYQLLWLGYLPLGTVHYTDNTMGAYVSTASLFFAARIFCFDFSVIKAAIVPSLFMGVLTGLTGLHIRTIERRLNSRMSDTIITCLKRGDEPRIMWGHCSGIALAFLKGVVMAAVGIPVFTLLLGCMSIAPLKLINSLSEVPIMATGAASATAVLFYWVKRRRRFLLAGLLCGIACILARMV